MMFPLFVFVLSIGLIMGSFLNCLIYRLYNKKSLGGRSFCPKCHHKIHWFENIPVLSFIFLHGRCHYCREKISWQYPLVELITGLLFLAVVCLHLTTDASLNIPFWPLILRDWLMILAMVFIFVYDLRFYIIEDKVILPIALIIFLINLFLLKIFWLNLLLSTLGAAMFFLVQYLATRGKGIGLGDFRIGLLLGAYFSWPKILLAILASYLIGSLVGLVLVVFRQKKWASMVPLGPFLALGSLVTIFWGQEIVNWYLRSL